MPELADPRLEAFARNLALGMKQHEAYEKAGFAPDPTRSNAAKKAKTRAVVERVAEIQADAAAQTILAVGDISALSGERLLRLGASKAVAQNNLPALIQAGKAIGEADGSIKALDPRATEDMSVDELCRRLEQTSGLSSTLFRSMLADDFSDPVQQQAEEDVRSRLGGRHLREVFKP